ncbi:MAG TPA: hypothetical protein PK530_24820, partial [Anaerolineales bacterium]|nr:hypothetical protein [Anaerolineales bacterium]
QYPTHETGYWDANWLFVEVEVRHPNGSWTVVSPCLLTFEVENLAQWFEQVTQGTNRWQESAFTEPCLKFETIQRDGNPSILRIYFEIDARPTWAYSRAAGLEDLWVEFTFDEINLLEAANHLRELLKKYPQRVFRDS